MENNVAVPIKPKNKNEKQHILTILYQVDKGETLINSVKKTRKRY